MLIRINERFIYDTERERVYHIMPRPWIYDPLAMDERVNIMGDDEKPVSLTKKELQEKINEAKNN